MPTNTILDAARGSEGYLWFATYDGLIRFDGVTFKLFHPGNCEAFTHPGVNALYEDKQGNLWIGTDESGLIRYKDFAFHRLAVDSTLRAVALTAITQDATDRIWVGTKQGLAFLDTGKVRRWDHPQLKGIDVTALIADEENNLWIGTAGEGLFQYNYLQDSVWHYPYSWKNVSINGLCRDRKGNLWIGTARGLSLLDPEQIRKHSKATRFAECRPADYFVNTIYEDSYGSLWFGTEQGIIRYAGGQWDMLSTSEGFAHPMVQAIIEDGQKNLWIGSYRHGIGRIKKSSFLNYGVAEGLPDEIVNTIYPEDTCLWIGTVRGLASMKKGVITATSVRQQVKAIHRDQQGKLWIATSEGLINFTDHQKYTIRQGLPSSHIRTISEDQQGNLWIGTSNGLAHGRDGTFEAFGKNDGLENEFVMSTLVDSHNHLWVGTNGGGLHRYTGDRFVNFSVKEGLPSNIIFQVYEDKEGTLWIGTGNGLARYTHGRFTSFNTKQGLPANTVYQILEDNTHLWMTTDKGVIRADKSQFAQDSLKTVSYKLYDQSDGMRTSQVTGASSAARGPHGKLWIATLKGMAMINPAALPGRRPPPNVLIEQVRMDSTVLPANQPVTIPAGTQRVQFQFTAFDYSAPEKIRFHYYLEGFDTYWMDADNSREVTYTGLPPGSYVFRVIAENSDGYMNRQGASIQVYQRPHFYQTLLFKALILLASVLLVFGYNFYRSRSLKKTNKKLVTMVRQRTESIEQQKAELEQLNTVKNKLLSVISHDLRSPLNSLQGMLHLLDAGALNVEEFVSMSKSLDEQVNILIQLMDNMLTWTKSQMQGIELRKVPVSVYSIAEDNLKLFKASAQKKNITLKNLIDPHTEALSDPDLVNLVMRNLVANAIKFTRQGGEVIIGERPGDGHLVISVTDNGVGMSQEQQEKLFSLKVSQSERGTADEMGTGLGLVLCKEFVEISGGKIWVQSEPGKGSTFRFTLKASPRHVNV